MVCGLYFIPRGRRKTPPNTPLFYIQIGKLNRDGNQKALIEFKPTSYCCCQPMCINNGVIVISVKMHLLTLWSWPLTFQPQNPNISRIPYPKVIPYTNFEHFGIIRFLITLRTNRQTNRRSQASYPRRPITSHPYLNYRKSCSVLYLQIFDPQSLRSETFRSHTPAECSRSGGGWESASPRTSLTTIVGQTVYQAHLLPVY